jgi:hypothetical protein
MWDLMFRFFVYMCADCFVGLQSITLACSIEVSMKN